MRTSVLDHCSNGQPSPPNAQGDVAPSPPRANASLRSGVGISQLLLAMNEQQATATGFIDSPTPRAALVPVVHVSAPNLESPLVMHALAKALHRVVGKRAKVTEVLTYFPQIDETTKTAIIDTTLGYLREVTTVTPANVASLARQRKDLGMTPAAFNEAASVLANDLRNDAPLRTQLRSYLFALHQSPVQLGAITQRVPKFFWVKTPPAPSMIGTTLVASPEEISFEAITASMQDPLLRSERKAAHDLFAYVTSRPEVPAHVLIYVLENINTNSEPRCRTSKDVGARLATVDRGFAEKFCKLTKPIGAALVIETLARVVRADDTQLTQLRPLLRKEADSYNESVKENVRAYFAAEIHRITRASAGRTGSPPP